jgi:hypothetical protein
LFYTISPGLLPSSGWSLKSEEDKIFYKVYMDKNTEIHNKTSSVRVRVALEEE